MEPFIANKGPYEMLNTEKETFLFHNLKELCAHHAAKCGPYGNLYNISHPMFNDPESCPYIPVSIFKETELRSSDAENGLKVITSSSTTSGRASRVFIDRISAEYQKHAVRMIFSSFIGNRPRTYIIFDDIRSARGKNLISARGAAIMSLMSFASRFFFVMKERDGRLEMDIEELDKAIAHAEKTDGFIAYGFTYILYMAHTELERRGFSIKKQSMKDIHFLHSGGWKKMQEMSVDKPSYNSLVSGIWNIDPSQVIDFYGMAEHVGVIYPDCPEGNKHVPYFADVIIRDPATLEPLSCGETGLIQLISLLAHGGPTHSIMTEDMGELVLEDNCQCGRKGKAFRFSGRVQKTEIRGCGDVYANR